jgi:hypothetical protein
MWLGLYYYVLNLSFNGNREQYDAVHLGFCLRVAWNDTKSQEENPFSVKINVQILDLSYMLASILSFK